MRQGPLSLFWPDPTETVRTTYVEEAGCRIGRSGRRDDGPTRSRRNRWGRRLAACYLAARLALTVAVVRFTAVTTSAAAWLALSTFHSLTHTPPRSRNQTW